jgi:hypothetical protein
MREFGLSTFSEVLICSRTSLEFFVVVVNAFDVLIASALIELAVTGAAPCQFKACGRFSFE